MKRKGVLFCLLILLTFSFALTGCRGNNKTENENNVNVVQNDKETHYLKFMENNAEVLRLVVLEGETYDDLLPFFPTLTAEPGFVKYWDGDYKYTNYSKENQFAVYSDTNKIIEIYAYMEKV